MEAQNYELMIITVAGVGAEPVLAKAEKSIKEAGASSLKVEKLGKKILSYPIAKQQEGEYVLFNFEAPPETIGAISKMLRLEREAILRYLITRTKVARVSRVPRVLQESTVDKKVKEEKPKAKVIVTTKTATKTATKVSKVSKVPRVSKAKKRTKH